MIKALKLSTGEELICDLTKVDEMYKANHPAQLIVIPGDGKETFNRLSLVPFALYIDEQYIMINPAHIVWESVPGKRMTEHYSQHFGSGITLHDPSEVEKFAKFMDAAK
jgi:hypothetical protein